MVDNKEKEWLETINKWIKTNLTKSKDYHKCLEEVGKLDKFLKENEYNISFDGIIELLDNSIFNSCIKTIFNHDRELIMEEGLDGLFKSEFLTDAIEAYCTVNDINLSDDLDLTDSNLSDGLKIYINSIRNFKVLSPEEEQELARKIKAGDEDARTKFIESNLKYVINIANLYRNYGLTFEDLIQEGNSGLVIAVERFDPSLGFRFSTYSRHWIKQRIIRAINDCSRTIRIPSHIIAKYNKCSKAENDLTKELGRKPTIEELSQRTGLSIKELKELEIIPKDVISTDTPVNEENDTSLGELIPDTNCDVEEQVMTKFLQAEVDNLLENSCLSPREIDVLKYRFAFDGGEPKKFDEIGEKYNITRQRAQQIETSTIKKLRKSKLITDFDEYSAKVQNIRNRLAMVRSGVPIRSFYGFGDSEIKYSQGGKTIYEYFSGYSEAEVDAMIDELSYEEKALLIKRYGTDLNSQHQSSLSEDEKKAYYSKVFPRMKKILTNNRRNREKTRNESVKVAPVKRVATKEDIILMRLKRSMNGYEYNQLVNVLNNFKQNSLLQSLDILDLIILILNFGYINGKSYGISEISRMLNIDSDRTKKIIEDTLQEYKSVIISSFDNGMVKTLSLE